MGPSPVQAPGPPPSVMAESYRPRFRQRSRPHTITVKRWSTPAKLLLGLYLVTFIAQLFPLSRFGFAASEMTFALSGEEVIRGPWRLVTFLLFHSTGDLYHFIMIFLTLLVVTADLEERVGWRMFGLLFLAGGLGGGLSHLAISAAFPSLVAPSVRTLGASGAAYGLLCAYFWHFRDSVVFGLIRGKFLGLILVAAIFGSGWHSHGGEGIEYRTQAAGLLMGASVLFLQPRLLRLRARRASSRKVRSIVADAQVAVRVDELLEKISLQGLGALSRSEKRFLRRASEQYRRGFPKSDAG